MWGYEVTSEGSHGYVGQTRSGWSEGDLWLLKAAVSRSKNAGVSAQDSLFDAIEANFRKIMRAKIERICADKFDMTLYVLGSYNFVYRFYQSQSAFQTELDLLWQIAKSGTPMGDQVALGFFESIYAYQIHAASKMVSGANGPFWLRTWVRL